MGVRHPQRCRRPRVGGRHHCGAAVGRVIWALVLAASVILLVGGGLVPSARAADPTAAPPPSASSAPTAQPSLPPTAEPSPSASIAPSPAPLAAPTPTLTLAPSPAPTPSPTSTAAPPDPRDGLKPGATEVVSLRTESSQTYDNHDGTMTSVFASGPKFYQPEGSKSWLPISVGFAVGTKTDGLVGAVPAVSSDRAPTTVSLFDLTARDFVTVGQKGRSVGFALPLDLAKSAKPTAPVVDGVAADYRDVFPGADLRVIARASGSKAFVILRGIPADAHWTFRVDAPGLALVPQDNGSISLVDASGTAIGQIPHPYALDSTVDELAGP